MKFPEHLDDDDMQLFKKEARLVGCLSREEQSSREPAWRAGMVFSEGFKQTGYIQAEEGLWVLIPSGMWEWEDAIRYADKHEREVQER